MKMLEYTFQHLSGFGSTKEKELWNRKIYTWSDLEKSYKQQLNFAFDDHISLLSESKNKLSDGDVTYFTTRLPNSLHFLIPHSFPEDTIFLDIETTGLSVYYDKINIVGWSRLDEYDVFIQGDYLSEQKLIQSIASAKTIITFNGSMFDLPFLRKYFENISVPQCHIDLRFFSKRLGYQGGQKKIEQQLGFQRPDNLLDVDGYAATILWYKYKEGDLESLKQLIQYNAFDIEGMKFIFEELTLQLIEKEGLPIKPTHIYNFSNHNSQFHFTSDPDSEGIFISHFSGDKGPSCTIGSLKSVVHEKIVGIDLTGSEKRATGWALIENKHAVTKTIFTDEELISETIKHNPAVISIDSPLSIPIGRTSFFDDDPFREEFGITRECERIMAKRGIKSYPCLIPTMQMLTQRGMKLASKFRELGYTVIESYPGAAQDIMGIPRKGKSLEFLTKGLNQFGILGEYAHSNVSHDEIDAITSAIVGYFYMANQFEALGNESEGYLIVPKIS